MILAHVQDGIFDEGLAATYGVDGMALIKKINALDTLSLFALADAIEVFWARVFRDETTDPDEILDSSAITTGQK